MEGFYCKKKEISVLVEEKPNRIQTLVIASITSNDTRECVLWRSFISILKCAKINAATTTTTKEINSTSLKEKKSVSFICLSLPDLSLMTP